METLYRLPNSTHPARRFIALAAASTFVLLMDLAQVPAAHLRFSPLLGRPWVQNLQISPGLTLGLSFLLAASFLLLLFTPYRRQALVFAPAYGLCWGLVQGPLYSPAAIWVWHRSFPSLDHYLGPFRIASSGLVLLLVASSLLALLFWRKPKPDLHGSARWATTDELAKLDLLPSPSGSTIVGPPGHFIGLTASKHRPRPLYLKGPHHVLLTGPTRSGKGVGYVLPYLLTTPESLFVLDIKSELWGLTAGARAHLFGQRVLRLDPTSFDTHCFNPLLSVRPHPHDVQDANAIADLLVDPDGQRERTHWDNTAHSLLTALILHVVYAEEEKTLARCAALLAEPGQAIEQTYRRVQKTHHLPEGPHPVIAAIMQENLDRHVEEASGVKSSALTFLKPYRDPLIAHLTSRSDFTASEFYDTPTSLYITVPPSQLVPLRPLLRLLLNQFCRDLTNRSQNRSPKVCLLIDEFPALGGLPFFESSLGFLAGYGVRAFLIAQDLAQIESAYGRGGRRETITANCYARIFLTPANFATARQLSDALGSSTLHHSRRTLRNAGVIGGDHSTTPTETGRRLLTPDEVLRLPPNEAVLLLAGSPPIRSHRLRYWLDPELERRARYPPPAILPPSAPPLHPWHATVQAPDDVAAAPSYRALPRRPR